MGYDSKTRYEAIKAIRNGATLMQVEGATGVGHETVKRWCVAEAIRFHDETNTAETFQSIASRAMGFLQDAAKLHGIDSNILVVTHAFLIKTMLFVIEPERLDVLGKIGNGSFVKLYIE